MLNHAFVLAIKAKIVCKILSQQFGANLLRYLNLSDEYRIFRNAPVATRITCLQTCVELNGKDDRADGSFSIAV